MKRLVIFQHIAREHPSYIAEYARDRNIGIDIVKLWEPHTMPDLKAYDGLIVLGGPMAAYEEYPGKQEELAALREHSTELPMLGICLGAQLLGSVLGAKVFRHEHDGRHVKEIGHYNVALTEEGKRHQLFKGFPEELTVLQWHGDTFDVPDEALLLATGSLCKNQAFSNGNVHGVQFHFEATPEMIDTWISADETWTHEGFTLDEELLRTEAVRLAPVMKAQCYRLLDNFLSR